MAKEILKNRNAFSYTEMDRPCCQLGAILELEKVLFVSDNFFVAPTIGPIGIEGYLMILSKRCYTGVGDIPEGLYTELEEVTEITKKVLKEVYGTSPQIFEHGPRVGNYRGGGCLDHAHLHVVPGVNLLPDVALDLMERLDRTDLFYRVDRTDGFKRAADIFHNGRSSYFMAESPDSKRVFVEVNFHIPSQYMRQLIARQRGTDKWDWGAFPDLHVVERTLDALRGRF